MIGSKTNHCLFCKFSLKKTRKIFQTKNFFLITDGAPLGPRHMLLIPNKHISCYGNLPKNLNKEFYLLKEKISAFLEKNYGRFIMFEHGIFGQTVFHAHLHFLPTEKKVLPFVSKTYAVKKIKDFSSLKEILKKDNGYLYFNEDSSGYVIKVKNPPAGFFHTYLLPKLLNVSDNFAVRAKTADEVFNQVKKLWKDIEA
jgi:diadenosine tetraphosphate (Ap4A) HIT family hydrolase